EEHEHHHDHDHEEHEHHHDHDHEEHEHHHDHDHDHEEHEHHHDHDHEHHHHYDENGVCSCGHHHHDHDADEVFTSWGMETPDVYTKEEVEQILKKLDDQETYGYILRSKGMLPAGDGSFIHFDYVPEESEVRSGSAEVTGKICVIGSDLKEDALKALFIRSDK
nr:GTP-binding protein [Lachnospiraceae bacterium]